ncbi:hypothetical protein NA57DRAFT_65903 [Rhizodiscina lignyota]|uniref:MPN domain-containing protein n=1 Tax=Rhizodiscina lignyota TaxID=1504668 RepID=A0A9P4M786_9PEZI|nr:hypothetical protein NA57DRAFT_65903 [Rhizodiscina lignyota]
MAANAVHLPTPLNVEEISRKAADYDYDPDIPLRYWLRTADAIQKQAQSYQRDGDDQDAYLFFLRHALLVIEKLPTHSEAKLAENRKPLAQANKVVHRNLKTLEELRPGINKRHQRYEEAMARRREEREKAADERRRNGAQQEASLADEMDGMNLGGNRGDSSINQKRSLEAKEHRDLAAKLARREEKKRRKAYTAEQEGPDDLSKHIIEAGKRGQQTFQDRNDRRSSNGAKFVAAPPRYPTVPQKSDFDMKAKSPPTYRSRESPAREILRQLDSGPPSLPPKEREYSQSPPPLPSKVSYDDRNTPSPVPRSTTATPDVNPRDFTFKPSAFLESGTPLRTIFLPPNLRSKFLSFASQATSMNREFLGILCGTLISNAFFISKLVIPEQEATSDTCEMTDEVGLWEYCDREDLLTLGWIHTHPTQTCFMSSRDLHTHGGYQAQMAESIAIVCAPRHEPSWGVFRLTDPPGLKHILSCRQSGIFHPHSETNLYTDAMKPGHVCELPGLEFEVVDLRK